MTMRKLATIRKVRSIVPIEDADRIELVLIDGWQCVAKKHEFKESDLCVYFEVDSYLPMEPQYEFLRESSYRKMPEPLQGHRSEGFRLRTTRLRGQLSQGLALPLGAFASMKGLEVVPGEGLRAQGQMYGVGSDVTALLDIEKYEPPIPASLSGEVKGMLPSFLKKTDEERIQNLPEYFERYRDMAFEVSEKLDGTSMTVYLHSGEVGVCSRGLDLLENRANTLWRLTLELELERHLREWNQNLALQGEVVGEGIQKNRLKLKGQKFFLFNVWDIDTRSHLTPAKRQEVFAFLAERTPIAHVPVIHAASPILTQYKNVESLLDFAAGSSQLNPGCEREGLVFKSTAKVGVEVISFKAISNQYLLKHRL